MKRQPRKPRYSRPNQNRLKGFEILEPRRVLSSAWQNPLFRLDADNSGEVAPLDALLIINAMNRYGVGPITDPLGTGIYSDTSGNMVLEPLDALLVINHINRNVATLPMELVLAQDSGESSTDKITNQGEVRGKIDFGAKPLVMARARTNRGEVTDLAIDSAGGFTFSADRRSLAEDGNAYVTVYATDGDAISLKQLRFVLDTTAPQIAAPRIIALDDTGRFATDNVTKNNQPRIEVLNEDGERLKVKLDQTLIIDDQRTGIVTGQLPILADGNYSLETSVTDRAGNTHTLLTPIIIDTRPPSIASLGLATSSDSGVIGDSTTQYGRVTLIGQTEKDAYVSLQGTNDAVRSDNSGQFRIIGKELHEGDNLIAVFAEDVAGNQSAGYSNSVTLQLNAVTSNPVLDWNQQALEAIRRDATTPPIATRNLAMVSLAMYDTLNAIEGNGAYLVQLAPPSKLSLEAALSAAALTVLSHLYPAQVPIFAAASSQSLNTIPDSPAKTAGIEFGKTVAETVISLRQHDGWDRFVNAASSTEIGRWRATAPMFDVAQLPQWSDLQPFAVADIDELLPAGPPTLSSEEYASAVNEVMQLGSLNSATRTTDQTQQARFWSDGAGTYTPPGHWNAIAQELAISAKLSQGESARLFAVLNLALGDAAIAAWKAKYRDQLWRPATAIQMADQDTNPQTSADPEWTSFLIAPPHPEYVSGHSTFSSAAATVLAHYFGDQTSFSTTSLGLPNVIRNYTSFSQAAAEAGRSRIFGGIHFEFSNQDGQATGRAVANAVLTRFNLADDSIPPSVIFSSRDDNLVVRAPPEISGWVIDNLSGVATSSIELDEGPETQLGFDEKGRFVYTPTLAIDGTADGLHKVRIAAVDHAGQTSLGHDFQFTLDTRPPEITFTTPFEDGPISHGQLLAGMISGTGSPIVSLDYQIDSMKPISIGFNSLTGFFSQEIQFSQISLGDHRLTLTATDAAGNHLVVSKSFTLDGQTPLTVKGYSPPNGATDVGSTYRPQVHFSKPVDPATLTHQSFYAEGPNNQKLSGKIVPAQDGTFAWLFFDEPMPSSSLIHVYVDGNLIKTPSGQPLYAGDNGVAGGLFSYQFSTVSLRSLPNTVLRGRVVDPGSDLKMMTSDDILAGPDGALHTPDDVFRNPIEGATVFVLGWEGQSVRTDAQGYFELAGVPAGIIKLAIDGRTASNAPNEIFWPEMVMDLELDAGAVNTVMGTMGTREERAANADRLEVYLPRLTSNIFQSISSTEATTVTANASAAPNLTEAQRQALKLRVTPDVVIGADGQPLANPRIGISTVPPELVRDMLPPGLLQHTFDITIQAPDAAVFSSPLEMTFPNVFNSAPGSKLNFLSFDHTTGRLIIEGTATVSADGLSVTTDAGSGITKPGWHGLTPPGVGIDPVLPPPNGRQDRDGDGNPDAQDPDDDNNGINDTQEDLDQDGIPDIDDPDDDNNGIKDDEEQRSDDYVISVAIGADFSIQGELKYSFGYDLPGDLFSEITQNEFLPLQYTGSLKFPTPPYTISGSVFTKQFVLDEFWADLIPAGTWPIIDIDASLGMSAAIGVGGLIDIEKDEAEVDFENMELRPGNVSVDYKFRISGSPLCQIPFEIGEVICRTHSRSTPIFGLPNMDVPKLKLKLPFRPLRNFNDEFFVGVMAGFNVNFSLSPTIIISKRRFSNPSPAGQIPFTASTGQSQQTPTTRPSFITSTSILDTHQHYYRFDIEGSPSITGRSETVESINVFLPSEKKFTLTTYATSQNAIYSYSGTTGLSGTIEQITLNNVAVGGFDKDNDGLSDLAEFVIGTDDTQNDSDFDRVLDLAELQQGSDPLSSKQSTTGILAKASFDSPLVMTKVAAVTISEETKSIAYGILENSDLVSIDVSDALKPKVLSQTSLPGRQALDIDIDPISNIAIVANDQGVHFIDISSAGGPSIRHSAYGAPTQLEIINGIAYVAEGTTINAYEASTGEKLYSFTAGDNLITGMAHEGSIIYLMDNQRVLRALDSSGGALTPRGVLTVPQGGSSISVGNGIAYISTVNGFATAAGFATVDVSNPDAMNLLSAVDAPNIQGQDVVVNGSGLAIAVGSLRGPIGQVINSLDIVDARDPSKTDQFLARIELPSPPSAVTLAGGFAFVSGGASGLLVVNYMPTDNKGNAPQLTVDTESIDFDNNTDGIQVVEGQLVTIGVSVIDDVQVRAVQLLLNDEIIQTAVSFPYELSFVVPKRSIATLKTALVVRAIDTGGNSVSSDPLDLAIIPDSIRPEIVSVLPNRTEVVQKPKQAIVVNFSEPIDASTLETKKFQLIGSGGVLKNPESLVSQNLGKQVLLTFEKLPLGSYTLAVLFDTITDYAGNALQPPNADFGFSIVQHVPGSILFDGINDYIEINDNASLRLTQDLTVECWINFTGAIEGAFVSKPFGGTFTNSFAIWYQGGKLRAIVGTGSDFISEDWLPSPNQWYHLAFSYSATLRELRLFIDGVEVGRAAGNPAPVYDDSPLFIGADRDYGVPVLTFNGLIDQVRIWSSIRTDEQLSNERFKPIIRPEDELRLQLLFEEQVGLFAADSSGLGNNGKLGGTQIISRPNWSTKNAPFA